MECNFYKGFYFAVHGIWNQLSLHHLVRDFLLFNRLQFNFLFSFEIPNEFKLIPIPFTQVFFLISAADIEAHELVFVETFERVDNVDALLFMDDAGSGYLFLEVKTLLVWEIREVNILFYFLYKVSVIWPWSRLIVMDVFQKRMVFSIVHPKLNLTVGQST